MEKTRAIEIAEQRIAAMTGEGSYADIPEDVRACATLLQWHAKRLEALESPDVREDAPPAPTPAPTPQPWSIAWKLYHDAGIRKTYGGRSADEVIAYVRTARSSGAIRGRVHAVAFKVPLIGDLYVDYATDLSMSMSVTRCVGLDETEGLRRLIVITDTEPPPASVPPPISALTFVVDGTYAPGDIVPAGWAMLTGDITSLQYSAVKRCNTSTKAQIVHFVVTLCCTCEGV